MAKKGLVLAGGGSRGAYQVGVWRALCELGQEFQVVTGSSVGALNGAMVAQGDLDAAEMLWRTLYTADIVAFQDFPREADYSRPGWEAEVWLPFIRRAMESGGADFSPLEQIIRKYVEEERVRQSPVAFGLVTVEYPSMKPAELAIGDIPQGKLCDYLLGSAACFPAFRSKEIDGVRYIDGGYHDNMPVNLAIRMGAEEILAVNLDGIGVERKPKDASIPVKYLGCYWDLGPFLWFEPGLSGRNMQLGYLDAMKLFERYEGWAYTFERGTADELSTLLGKVLGKNAAGWSLHLRGLSEWAAWHRIGRALRRKRPGLKQEKCGWLAAAELAGEYVGADPLPVYTAQTFLEALREAWGRMDSAADHPDGWQAVRSMRRMIREHAADPDSGFWQSAALSPEAFVTGAVLELMESE